MPDMSGTEMIKQIYEINPTIPIILCSGYNVQASEKENLDLGIIKYLGKPVSNQLMLKSAQEALQT